MKRLSLWIATIAVLTCGVALTTASQGERSRPSVRAHKVFYRFYQYDANGGPAQEVPRAQIESVRPGRPDQEQEPEVSFESPGAESGRANCGAAILRSHKYARIETVAGLTAYVTRRVEDDPNEPIESVERYYAVETGCTLLKQVTKLRSGVVTVREAKRVEFR